MIQFNLIPDVKKEYIKVKRVKRLITSVAVLVAGGALGITILLFLTVQIGQKGHINRLGNDIDKEITALESVNDLNKILTIQNQLNTIPELHQQKPETSRIFSFMNQMTPVEVKLQEINIDLENTTMEFKGTADSLAAVNEFADVLKFVTYNAGEETTQAKPFSDVNAELARDEERATYTITLVYDPAIFDNKLDITLNIPSQVTTRSVIGRPDLNDQTNSLFEDANKEGE